MAHVIQLWERLTHTYSDAWRHLDEERYIGQVKQLGLTKRVMPTDYDDGGKYQFRVVAPSELKGVNLTRSIAATLSGSGCTHEHDCCGCSRSYARVKRISKREYGVVVSVSYNY